MFLLHGENTVQSRNRLITLIDEAKAHGKKVDRIDAKMLDTAKLQEILGSQSLFGDERLIVVEELHSLPKSKKKDELIWHIANADSDIILWEKRALTPTMIKQFPGVKAEEFKLTNAVFAWLDTLSGAQIPTQKQKMITSLRKAIAYDSDAMCFTMLIRQIRMLLQIKDGGTVAGAPFMIAKLKKQASTFSLEQLFHIHAQLLRIDVGWKTSTLTLGLARELELLLLTM